MEVWQVTLGNVLEKLNQSFELIVCRTIISLPDEGDTDIFVGQCRYIDKPFPKLIPLDGDEHSFDDEIIDYKVEDGDLIVWYKTKQ